MPLPTTRDVHVDRPLTNLSIAYRNDTYIADMIFSAVPVTKKSDSYYSYDKSYHFRDEAARRAPGTYARVGGYATSTTTYLCVGYSIAKDIPDEVRENADDQFNLDREALDYVSDKIMMRRENAFVTDHFTTGVWGTDQTGGTDFTVWSNYAGSNPLTDIEGWQDTVEGKIAKTPRDLVIGRQVWTKLKWHPDVIDSIKYTQKAVMSEDLFASMVGLERFLVGKAIITTDKEGTAEASVTYSRIWGKHALLHYRAPAAGLMTLSSGYTFFWNRPGKPGQSTVYRYRDDRARTDFIEAESFYDQKIVASDAGLFASGAVS